MATINDDKCVVCAKDCGKMVCGFCEDVSYYSNHCGEDDLYVTIVETRYHERKSYKSLQHDAQTVVKVQRVKFGDAKQMRCLRDTVQRDRRSASHLQELLRRQVLFQTVQAWQ